MSNMQAFYKMLITNNDGHNQHANALVAITRANHSQLSALSSELAWQIWGA